MSGAAPDVVNRYFAALNGRDGEGLLAVFSPDAVVVDEGQPWRGTTEIRTWVEDVVFRFQYRAEVLEVEDAGDGKYIARVRLEGDFPGGTVELNVRFEVDGNRIRWLENMA